MYTEKSQLFHAEFRQLEIRLPRERTWAALTAVLAVMLSAAKHLGAHRARCFAALSMTAVRSRQTQSSRGGVTSSLFATLIAVLKELLSMLISKYLC
jgi:hypothetical protein